MRIVSPLELRSVSVSALKISYWKVSVCKVGHVLSPMMSKKRVRPKPHPAVLSSLRCVDAALAVAFDVRDAHVCGALHRVGHELWLGQDALANV